MKKTFLALSVLVGGLFAANNAQAQMVPGSELSIGVSPMLPVGDLSKTQTFGVGGDLQYGYNFDESIGLTLSTGYNQFFGKKENNTEYKNFGAVPIKAGVKYGIGSFYIHPQLGVSIPTTETKVAGVTGKYQPGFAYGIGLGTNVAGFDLSLRYEAADHKYKISSSSASATSNDKLNAGFVGLRLGYTLPVGR